MRVPLKVSSLRTAGLVSIKGLSTGCSGCTGQYVRRKLSRQILMLGFLLLLDAETIPEVSWFQEYVSPVFQGKKSRAFLLILCLWIRSRNGVFSPLRYEGFVFGRAKFLRRKTAQTAWAPRYTFKSNALPANALKLSCESIQTERA